MDVIGQYRYWDIVSTLPNGWQIDNTVGSPLYRHVFATNGKSPLSGQQQRVLIPVEIEPIEFKRLPTCEPQKKPERPQPVIDENYRRTMNTLARKRAQEQLLRDIVCDLTICDLEGWDKIEYLNELKALIDSFLEERQRSP